MGQDEEGQQNPSPPHHLFGLGKSTQDMMGQAVQRIFSIPTPNGQIKIHV